MLFDKRYLTHPCFFSVVTTPRLLEFRAGSSNDSVLISYTSSSSQESLFFHNAIYVRLTGDMFGSRIEFVYSYSANRLSKCIFGIRLGTVHNCQYFFLYANSIQGQTHPPTPKLSAILRIHMEPYQHLSA